MEGFFAEQPYSTNCEQIDLTLKLSPCGQDAEETRWSSMSVSEEKGKRLLLEKGLMRFGDLQTMRRVRTGKRLLLEKQRRAAAAEADKSRLNTLPNPNSGDSWHLGGASSNIQTTSPKQENNSMVYSPSAMLNKEMTERPCDTNLESPAKKHKQVNPCLKGGAMDIMRQMPSVTTTGDGPRGKRIEGLLYRYSGGQVCIVCVCHGSFLSPAEFVMHAGGKEVANPMKHITLSSDSFYINGDDASAFIS